MSQFSQVIESYWHETFHAGNLLFRSDALTVTTNADLKSSRRLMLLETIDAKLFAVLTPAMADKLGLANEPDLTVALLRQKLKGPRDHAARRRLRVPLPRGRSA